MICLAPTGWGRGLRAALATAGLAVVVRQRPKPQPGPDPYRLRALADRAGASTAAVLLVVPPGRAPRTVIPGPVVGGLVVGLLPARRPEQLRTWLDACVAVHQPDPAGVGWAVLSEWEDHYLIVARRFARRLDAAGRRQVHAWLANRFNRQDLLRRLCRGPAMACYFGHGQCDGLVGYHGFWREHLAVLEAAAPMGVWAAFSCETLKRPRRGNPFGYEAMLRGRAAAYLGSVHSVRTADNTPLVALAGEVFQRRRPVTLARWLLAIDAEVSRDRASPAARAWRTYRLVGNPLQRL